MTNGNNNVVITEHYGDYVPPFQVKGLISELLCGVSNRYLRGLQAVVLNSSSGLNRKSRRQKTLARKRKVAIADCRGVYNQKWHDGQATIQLFVDNIIESRPRWIIKIPFFRRMVFAEVLFHELGHHIHHTTAPEHKEREDVAEEWRKRLTKEYTSNRYGYLKPLKPLLKIVAIVLRTTAKIIGYFTEKKLKNREK
ncbi:MAG: hypothetical protein WC855_00620 [Thermodesulfovibrionales bacterium]